MMFPTRSGPNEIFLPGTDLGLLAQITLPSIGLVASAGAWNGTGKEVGTATQDSRGLLLSGRVDWTFGGDFPFIEGDLSRGPFRLSLGGAILYRPSLTFDAAGSDGPEVDDLRLDVSIRMAFRGLYMQAEGLRRETTDSLSGITRGATGAYAQASYYGVIGPLGLSPVVRVGWAREDEGFNPRETEFLEIGLAFYPHPKSAHPESLRIALWYQGEYRTTEGEDAHRLVAQVQLVF
jgi:hypothetical protein